MSFDTREAWLNKAVELLRPHFLHYKLEIPEKVAVTCGWPSKGGLSTSTPRLGECWPASCTFDGINQIFITPTLKEHVRVLETLVHELVHACLPDDEKHGPRFKNAIKDIGLEGKVSATVAGADLVVRLEAIGAELGDYPNSAIHPADAKPKDPGKKATYKCFCAHKRAADNKCRITDKNVGKDYSVSVGKKMLDLGFPLCPCGHSMEMEEEDFKIWQDQKRNCGEGGVTDQDV